MSDEATPYLTPEARARINIDKMLDGAGWVVQDPQRDQSVREPGSGCPGVPPQRWPEADYLLFVDRKAVGALEAKKEGDTLTGVEPQSAKYADGLPDDLEAPGKPLPFLYESTGVETRFTNGLDPDARSREVFAVHRPETLAAWLKRCHSSTQRPRPSGHGCGPCRTSTTSLLWPAQTSAMVGLEKSLAEDQPRSLIQMATGSGKTYTAANASWRLIRHGGARRVLFLVDRANLGKQTQGEFERFRVPGDGRKFTELYNVQRLTSNRIDPAARVVICTIQRLYSILRGEEEFSEELDEVSGGEAASSRTSRLPTTRDTARDLRHHHRRRVPPQHLRRVEPGPVLLRCPHHRPDGHPVEADARVLQPEPRLLVHPRGGCCRQGERGLRRLPHPHPISEQGATVEKGTWLQVRDRATRKKRWEELDDDLTYGANELNSNVVAEDQIRTVIRHFRDHYGTELFPGRTTVPKTLIFAKDDSHADDIVRIVREEFGKGNDFCVKITYRTTGVKPEELLAKFRTSTCRASPSPST